MLRAARLAPTTYDQGRVLLGTLELLIIECRIGAGVTVLRDLTPSSSRARDTVAATTHEDRCAIGMKGGLELRY